MGSRRRGDAYCEHIGGNRPALQSGRAGYSA
jgi:hypothetical protein